MKRELNLSIPSPCHEKWENFEPQAAGGFCGACKKTVVDFTRMSDRQLLEYLQNKQAHTCGRFRPDQLKAYAFSDTAGVSPGFALLKAGVVGLFLMLAGRPAMAQSIPEKPATEISQYPEGIPAEESGGGQEREFIFKGIVNFDGQELLPGASVVLKGTTEGVTTDENGRFVFPRKLKAGDVLIVQYIGFLPLEYMVSRDSGEAYVPMSMKIEELMGALAIEETYTAESGLHKWWSKVKALF